MREILLVLTLLACRGACAEEAANRPAYWGSLSADGGKCCATLAEVRESIDRIDRELIRLMAGRGAYVAEAARFKKNPSAVADPARVDAVVQRVRAEAAARGLDPTVAERTFRATISAFVDFERAEWTKRQEQTPAKRSHLNRWILK
jgi:isochorismate pyruvate lyase